MGSYDSRDESAPAGYRALITAVIASTPEVVEIDGVQCRVWHGITSKGTLFFAFVHRVWPVEPGESQELAAEFEAVDLASSICIVQEHKL